MCAILQIYGPFLSLSLSLYIYIYMSFFRCMCHSTIGQSQGASGNDHNRVCGCVACGYHNTALCATCTHTIHKVIQTDAH